MNVSEQCSCGAKITVEDRSTFTSSVERVVKEWRESHIHERAKEPVSFYDAMKKDELEREAMDDLCLCSTFGRTHLDDCPIHGKVACTCPQWGVSPDCPMHGNQEVQQ